MAEEYGLKAFEKRQTAYTITILASGVAGAAAAYLLYSCCTSPALIYAPAGFGGILALAYWHLSAKPKIRVARRLLEECGNLVYLPRRHSFACRYGGALVCYSYATSKYYLVSPVKVEGHRRITPWTPLDYYCVKYLGGKLEKREGESTYKGVFEALTLDPHIVLIGEGTIIVGESLEDLLGRVSGLGEGA